ncbi:MAG TPA: citrate (Si)-synthase, partial [Candidatus Sumerlaeota bacterium]|nr:citrate (Si)-synthase [Candidatus Sumerlaeota bacterium]
MSQTCTLKIHDKEYPLNMITGTENEVGIDIAKLRDTTGCITLDSGYGNTGSCESAIT